MNSKDKKIQFFSEDTNLLYQLFPTKTIPTLKISGVPMHRFATIDPLEDTRRKILAAKPKGFVLDTCMGLGYTAICSAKEKSVEKVYTFEKDKNVLEIAKLNEASKELFENNKIILENLESNLAIKKFQNSFFDTIIHDPPTFKMAVELYTEAFYKEVKRVLKISGTFWHYCPNPGKLTGKSLKNSVEKKLKKFFKNVIYDESSVGFICKN